MRREIVLSWTRIGTQSGFAVKDRCCMVTLRADTDCLLDYGFNNNWSPKLLGFIRAFGVDVVDNGYNPDCEYGGATPRGFEQVQALEASGALDKKTDSVLELLLAGSLGPEIGAQYSAFRNINIPDPKLVFEGKGQEFSMAQLGEASIYGSAVVMACPDTPKAYQAVTDYCLSLPDVIGSGLATDLGFRLSGYRKHSSFAKIVAKYGHLMGN